MKKLIPLMIAAMMSLMTLAQDSGINYIEGELMLLLQPSTSIEAWCTLQNQETNAAFYPRQKLCQSMNLWLIEFDHEVIDTKVALHHIERNRNVILAQLNHTDLVVRSLPNDPFFDEQWAFDNNGSNGGSGTADISASEAWDLTTGGLTQYGDTIVVAVVDGGFTLNQEDLVENFYRNHHEIPNNNIDDDQNGYVDDVQGWNAYLNGGTHFNDNHGTHVSGTVGAKGNNGIGVTGVNWDVKVMPVSGSSSNESTVVSAYGYILDMRKLYNQTNGEKGAYVVATNSSFGVDYGDPAEYPLWCAMYDSLGYAGVLSAGATANLNINIDVTGDVPTSCDSDFLLSVTNTTSSDVKYSSAGFGAIEIDLAAPGTQIYSTLPSGYGRLTGTSMATPHVAGAIGLMYSAVCSKTLDEYAFNPGALALFMRSKLLNEGVDVLMSLNGLVASSGRLNLFNAVSSVIDSCMTVHQATENAACGMCDGEAEITVIGGVPPYAFLWTSGETTASISDLCPGIYTVTISDASSDSIVINIPISNDSGPLVSVDATHVSCYGGSDGTALLQGADTYVWEDGSQSDGKLDLSAGTYFVTATDQASSCTTIVEVVIQEPSPFTFDFLTTNPQPSAASNGTITVQVNGGAEPYSYDWSNGGNSSQLISLNSGNYVLTVTDANGCSYTDSIFLGFPLGEEAVRRNHTLLFPNPTAGTLFLKGPEIQSSQLSIYDVSGRVLLRIPVLDAMTQIDLSSFEVGNYVLIIENSAGSEQRLIQVVR